MLYPSLVEAPSARLAAVCDLQADRAQQAARRYGAERWYTDVTEMLAKETLDGVCICGPPEMHLSVGLRVLRHRLPIFVEKPSAMDSRGARQLVRAARRAGVWGMVAFMKRHAPGYLLAKSLIEAPGFGGLQQLHLRFTQGEYPNIWGLEAPRAFLVGQVVHIFDLLRFLGGDVAQVHARLRTVGHGAGAASGAERRAIVTQNRFAYAISAELASGALVTLDLNSLGHTEPWRDIKERVEATGVAEELTVEDMLSVTHYPSRDWRPESQQAFGTSYRAWAPNFLSTSLGKALCGYVGELEHYAQCLLSGAPGTPSLQDGVEALRLGEAVWRSAQTGRPVSLQRRPGQRRE
jgi:myo-inositol 2-dehydrogenase/D-chiro-inositol 1-dehydrogenase